MSFNFPCANCGTDYEVEEKNIGRRFRCKCGGICTVPAPKDRASKSQSSDDADEMTQEKARPAVDDNTEKTTKPKPTKAAAPSKSSSNKKPFSDSEDFDEVEVKKPSRRKSKAEDTYDYDINDDDNEAYEDYDEYEPYKPRRRSKSQAKAKTSGPGIGAAFSGSFGTFSSLFSSKLLLFCIPPLMSVGWILLFRYGQIGGSAVGLIPWAMSWGALAVFAVGFLSCLMNAAKEDTMCLVLWFVVPLYNL